MWPCWPLLPMYASFLKLLCTVIRFSHLCYGLIHSFASLWLISWWISALQWLAEEQTQCVSSEERKLAVSCAPTHTYAADGTSAWNIYKVLQTQNIRGMALLSFSVFIYDKFFSLLSEFSVVTTVSVTTTKTFAACSFSHFPGAPLVPVRVYIYIVYILFSSYIRIIFSCLIHLCTCLCIAILFIHSFFVSHVASNTVYMCAECFATIEYIFMAIHYFLTYSVNVLFQLFVFMDAFL